MRKGIVLLVTICLMYSCSKSSTAEPTGPAPTAATLSKPEKDNACVPVSTTSTTGVVRFEWAASQNTDSYTVVVANSLTKTEKKSTVSTTETTLILDRGAPYSWWVLSGATGRTATTKSEVWGFYLEGVQQQNHAPFLAKLINPVNGGLGFTAFNTNYVEFTWSGSDLDNDISHYQFHLGTSTSTLKLIKDNITHTNSETQSFNTLPAEGKGKTYYWRIITVDKKGIESLSEIHSFNFR